MTAHASALGTAEPVDGLAEKYAEKRYAEVCSAIRFTDEISFKLLSLVPTISGAAIIAVILKEDARPTVLIVLASLLGAIVTFAFYRWELRNIQTCRWLQQRAADIERESFAVRDGAFEGRREAPKLFGVAIGKTEAERIVYASTIAAWLLLPVGLALTQR